MRLHSTPRLPLVTLAAALTGLLAVACYSHDTLAQQPPATPPAAPTPAPPAAPPGSPSATDIATRVQVFYDATKTFQATFTQKFTIKVQNETKTSTGKVTFEKPGKMSWKYDAPNGNRVVSDGTTIKVYEQDNQQMFETPVKNSQYPAALSFLMGQGQLTRDFTLSLPTDMKFENGYVLQAIPKDASPAYQKMLLYIDAQTNQVRRALILDAQGNHNRFDFSAPTVNQPAAKDEFTFTPPPGTKIIK